MTVTERMSREERREQILEAASEVFAAQGLHGASTEDIAKAAGISQPYIFRLFGTKKDLYKAVVARCFRQTLEIFQRAAEGKRGEEAMHAIGEAYGELLAADPAYLRLQMQAYAACDDPEIRTATRTGFKKLWELVERLTGLPFQTVVDFFAVGMLMNVAAAMDLPSVDERWTSWCPKDSPA